MKKMILLAAAALLASGCNREPAEAPEFTPLESSVVYELNTRQFTPEGSFSAATKHLPELKATGIDIVWVMPLYPIGEKERKGSLGSYYAIRDYRAVNPEFGTLADFDSFVETAHGLGMRVIIDWVANHTSPDHPWVTEKPAEWYVRDAEGNTMVEYDWTDIAKLNYGCPEMRAEMKDCMRFWLDRGIDGFRCDMASIVPQDFWTEAFKAFREEYPRELYFLAEGEEAWLPEAGFDASYSWKLHHILNGAAQGKAGAQEILSCIQDDPVKGMRLAFTSNHDENSWSGTEFERMGEAWKAMTVLCWTLPGTQPLVYTGQELGWNKRFEFFEKDPMPAEIWEDPAVLEYQEFYARLADLRHTHKALWTGEGEFSVLPSEKGWLKFRRSCGTDAVTVAVQLEEPWAYAIETGTAEDCRIEPPCWWVGMNTPLQLMVRRPGAGQCGVQIEGGRGVKVAAVHSADSPNYLFVDVDIAPDAEPGTYSLVFSDGTVLPYELGVKGTLERKSFGTSDAIYLIMPDRFRNADPSNDNTPNTAEKADYKAFFGRHGGDLQGIGEQLDYIAGLGMTAIWCTPLLLDDEPEASYHGYACADYYRIDPRFGTNEDYRDLVALARTKGLKFVMDIVTNHCGGAHWWIKDLPFEDWIHQWPEYTHSNCAFSAQNDPYCSQLDAKNMKEGWFDTSMPDMNLDNPYLLQYFKQWACWWIEWAGVDGLRVDTFPYNEKEPMAQWCKAVREEYPWINIVGEVWSTNVAQVAYWQKGHVNPDGFVSELPSIMDFCLQGAICGSLNTDMENWDSGITKVYDSIANDIYFTDVRNMMIFPGNHDTDRIGDVVGKDPRKMKMVYALMATLRGFPQIFAGDELMCVSRDRSQGHGGLRVEFPDDWASDPVKKDLHDTFAALFNWRKGSDAVQNGKTLHFLTRQNTYAYFRYTDSDAVFTFLNNNGIPWQIPWADYAEFTSTHPGSWTDVLTGQTVNPENLIINEKSSIVLQYSPSGSVQQ